MRIYVNTWLGKGLTFDEISPETTVNDLKLKLAPKVGVPRWQQRLICGGKALYDDGTLQKQGITNESTMHLLLALRGGGGASFKFADPRKSLLSIGYAKYPTKNPIIVNPGLNLEVVCVCTGDHHYIVKGMGKFEMGGELDVKCPKCKEPTTVIGCGFAKCFYNWEGRAKDGFTAKGDGEARSKFMTTDSNEQCDWVYLNVETRPLRLEVCLAVFDE